jgi:hypothetical protein
MKFLPIILIFIIFSCSVEKRYHRSGWNFQRQSIHTPWKIKKSGQIPHELSENNSLPNDELDTTSSEKIDAIHLSKIDLTVNEKDTKNLAVETVTSDTLTYLIAHKKKKSALAQIFLRKEIENPQIFRKNNYRDAMANWQKPTYFDSGFVAKRAVGYHFTGYIFYCRAFARSRYFLFSHLSNYIWNDLLELILFKV